MEDLMKSLHYLGVTLFLLSTIGCGSDQLPTHPVNGKVAFQDGTFPMFGTIEFYNDEHKINARGKINRDGTFTVGTYEKDDGAVAGDHRVVIIQIVSEPGSPLSKVTSNIDHDHGELVSPKYLDYRSSDLSCSIQASENDVELIVDRVEKR